MARRYELKARAVAFEATRQRIVDATLALHEEVGPARTAITEVSRRAGVGRVTVYNHFPDEAALLRRPRRGGLQYRRPTRRGGRRSRPGERNRRRSTSCMPTTAPTRRCSGT